MYSNVLFAQDAVAPPAGGDTTGQQGDPNNKPAAAAGMNIMQFAPFILLGLFFLVVMLPAKRRQKREQEAKLASMKPGAKVITSSGIVGRIVSMKDGEDEIVIKSDDTKLRILKSTVTTIIGDDAAPAEVKS